MATRSPIITVMTRAAEKAGRGILRDFGEVEQLQVSKKGPADFVSQADLKAEKLLKDELARVRPDYGFVAEEGGTSAGRDPDTNWLIDPLDGTTNFLHGLPHWCVSVALAHKGEPVAGVIYDPVKDETFWAEKGAGAFLNEKRLRVSGRRDVGQALVATGMPFKGRATHPDYTAQLERVWAATAGIRRLGSAALDLAYVAAGRYDAYWEWGLKPWDIAAGLLIVTEAGGYATEPNGGREALKSGDVLAGNPDMHKAVGALLAEPAG